MNTKFLLATTMMLLSTAAAADDKDHAHHHHEPRGQAGFYGHLETSTYFTDIYKAAESDEEVSDIFSHSHFDGGYRFNRNWSVNGMITLEGDPAGHSHGGGPTRTGDRFFDDHPLFIEELTVNYDTDGYGAYAGKFNPVLGRDIHDVPGWFGMLTFEDFEIRERIGAGGYVSGDIDGLGHQRFDLSTFFADTTFLQESLLYNRDTLDKNDGGAANTEDFSSLAANIGGELGLENLNYYLGYAHQGNDAADGNHENRYALGLNYGFTVNADTDVKLIADMTDINHLEGEADHDRRYSTIGFGVDYKNWVSGATYTDVYNDAADADENLDGYITQVSIGYNFTDQLGADIGYQRQKEEGETSNRIGALVRYNVSF